MLEFRLSPPNMSPWLRQPKLNRAHPLYNQLHNIHAGVADRGGMLDFYDGSRQTNTTTKYMFGPALAPYVWSNDNAGTATITKTGPATSFQFMTWGCLFHFHGFNNQNILAFGSPFFGIQTTTSNIQFTCAGGTVGTFAAKAGHDYFAFMTNAVGTASQNRFMIVFDLTTGIVAMQTNASVDNIVANPISILQVTSSQVCQNLYYASFIHGAVLVPPAVTPAATFYSIDQVMAGIADPWGMWYA